MNNTKSTTARLEEILKEQLHEINKQEAELKSRIKREMPEFVKDYEELMVSVWRGEKEAADIAAWWAKYEHVLKTKSAKTDLNTK